MSLGCEHSTLITVLAVPLLTEIYPYLEDNVHTVGQELLSVTVACVHLIFGGHVPCLRPLSPEQSNGESRGKPSSPTLGVKAVSLRAMNPGQVARAFLFPSVPYNVTNYFLKKLIAGNSWFSVTTWKSSQSVGILQSITFFLSCHACRVA